MPSITVRAADLAALLALFGVHKSDDVAALRELITTQHQEILMALKDAETKAAADSAKLDQLVTEVHSLRDRVTAADAAKDAVLAAANTALSAAQAEIAALKAQAQSVPADTSALEAALDGLGTKLDAAKAEVAAIDAAPQTAPADPSAPQGQETEL